MNNKDYVSWSLSRQIIRLLTAIVIAMVSTLANAQPFYLDSDGKSDLKNEAYCYALDRFKTAGIKSTMDKEKVLAEGSLNRFLKAEDIYGPLINRVMQTNEQCGVTKVSENILVACLEQRVSEDDLNFFKMFGRSLQIFKNSTSVQLGVALWSCSPPTVGEIEEARKRGAPNSIAQSPSSQAPQISPDVEIKFNDGSSYLGKVKDGKPHGQGTYTWLSGARFIGESSNGTLNGQGTYTFSNGNRYVGEWKDSRQNGKGAYTWANGDQYVGEFKVGLKDGKGTLTTTNGARYVGDYKNDQMNGQGTFTWPGGDQYVGQFKDGLKDGQGTLTLKNGTKTVGLFKDDKYVGPQTNSQSPSKPAQVLNYSHGRYVGEVLNGKAHGLGTYTASKSGTAYTGEFVADTFSGVGTMIWTDGSKFVGKWQNDIGISGTITYANGTTSSGVVRSGVFTPSASQSSAQQSDIEWNHNNSKMKIDMVNNTINIYYTQPRQAMLDAGAKPNDLLVNGTIQNNQITGTARIFAGRCGQFTYPVTGNIFNNGREISLNGQAPIVNLSNCQVTRYVPDPLSFNLIQTNTQSNSQSQSSPSQANTDVEIKLANGAAYFGKVQDGKPNGKGTLTFKGLGSYKGEFKNGMMNGQGSYITNDSSYVGEFKDDKRHGQGTSTFNGGQSYVGEFKDDKYNGKGTLTLKDGTKQVGIFKDGKYVGPETNTQSNSQPSQPQINPDVEIKFNNGSSYLGKVKDGKPHGQGTYTFANGNRYIGEFKDGRRNGHGTFTWADGDSYTGEYQNNVMSGQGTYTWANGDRYVGEWKDGDRTGQGTYTTVKGDRYVGEHMNDTIDGRGTYTWASGDSYTGEFKNNMRSGQGTFTWANGNRYVGESLNGKSHGLGTYTSSKSGTVYTGEFVAGTFSGSGTMTWTNGSKFVGKWQNNAGVTGTMTYANGSTAIGNVTNAIFYAAAQQPQMVSSQPQQAPQRQVQQSSTTAPHQSNISIKLPVPRRAEQPARDSFQMLAISGENARFGRISIQIFSDGQASVIKSNKADWYRHEGNGVFSNDISFNNDNYNKIAINETARTISIDGVTVADLKFVKSEREKPVENMTFGEKINMPGTLRLVRDDDEAIAACAASGRVFGQRTDWAAKEMLLDANWYSRCLHNEMYRRPNNEGWQSLYEKWIFILSVGDEKDGLLNYLTRCQNDYRVTFNYSPNTGKSCGPVYMRR